MSRRSLLGRSSVAINPILQRVLDYAVSESITTPSGATLRHLNLYCNALETAGILAHTGAGGIPTTASDFTTSDVFVNFAYNNTGLSAFSLIDWIRLTQMTTSGGIDYTVEGWENTGVMGYLNTNYNPSTNSINYLQNDATRGTVIYKRTGLSLVDNLIDINRIGTTANDTIFSGSTNSNRINQGSAGTTVFGAGDSGLFLLKRDSSTTIKTITKSTEYSVSSTSSGLTNAVIHLLGHPVGTAFGINGLTNYIISKDIPFAQSQNLRTATNTYLTKIGLSAIA